MPIKYYKGYKYQLADDYSVQTSVTPQIDISSRFIKLTREGLLTIREDYAWDGPSGPTLDTPDSMRGSLVHDALYQLIEDGVLDVMWRETADRELMRLCREDGMSEFRAESWYVAVRAFGGSHLEPDKIYTAP